MKSTKYFYKFANFSQGLEQSIRSLIAERDKFVQENEALIGEIDSEEMVMQAGDSNNNTLILVIKLIYHPKVEE